MKNRSSCMKNRRSQPNWISCIIRTHLSKKDSLLALSRKNPKYLFSKSPHAPLFQSGVFEADTIFLPCLRHLLLVQKKEVRRDFGNNGFTLFSDYGEGFLSAISDFSMAFRIESFSSSFLISATTEAANDISSDESDLTGL